MSAKYLLPCSCGQKIPVGATQAGGGLRCECGAELEVPALRELTQLDRAEVKPTRRAPAPSWGSRQSVFFLGLVVMAAG
ncbi:MAG: hypothetical protein ACYTG0_40010, partial [Planctomycetota bacterium]